ncbi:CRTAC1 family protein [Halomicrobium sp. LC1Hm]|uniref:CRTAC1 family protein n=1 Tax=Halomicrobium sp. LC1Hm TaxID=2610902 RepID=UPI0012985258|nr:CRTAC1 family protein [Halomicrobium sp. LC1Hm]QGA82063.1 Uncharacterized protein LC1Hm_1003 [Halomicrobium sp. LC1Hm]
MIDRRTLAVTVVALLTVTAGCTSIAEMGGGGDTGGEIGFEDVTGEVGLNYSDDVAGGAGNGNAGVYVADVDNDGWDDVLAVGGERPVLFENTGGEFSPSGALPEYDRQFKSATFVDYDDDGWKDLLLLPRGGGVVALHNDEGSFEPDDVGLGNVTHPLGAAPADFDGDGRVDLFLYQSGDWLEKTPAGKSALNETLASDNGYPNSLYRNVGGEFERVEDAGIEGDRWSLAATATDLTGDGRPDIYVANDYNTDVLYVNEGDGTFSQRQLEGPTARNGMSVEVADFDGDRRRDVFVTNIELPISRDNMSEERYELLERMSTFVFHSGRTKGNTVMINQGNGTFEDRAESLGVQTGGWGWAATATDFDNDGDRDLMHATQNVFRLDPDDPHYTFPMLWERTDEGFENLAADERGLPETDGRGLVALDFDNDGDQDVISAAYGDRFAVYENTVTSDTDRLQFRAVDETGGTALGATVTVTGEESSQQVVQYSETDYLSQESQVGHVGLAGEGDVTITVTWPDGTERTFDDVAPNQRVRLSPDGIETVTTFPTGDQTG